jgi:DNA-binding MarR family transcriptional regulator
MKYDFSSNYLLPAQAIWQLFPEIRLQAQYSSIPLRIVLIALDMQKQGESLSLKELYSYFSCSHLTVKKFVDALVGSGYLQNVKSSTDSRVKYLLMTDKCSQLCHSLMPESINSLNGPLSENSQLPMSQPE